MEKQRMRFTVDLPCDVVQRLKAQAAACGLPVAELAREYLEHGLAGATNGSSTAQRSALPSVVPPKPLGLKVFSNASLQATLDRDDVAQTLNVLRKKANGQTSDSR